MPYKTRAEMILDGDMLVTGHNLLSSNILNIPHQVLANNFDYIKPSFDILYNKLGEDYVTARTDNAIPNYNPQMAGGYPVGYKGGWVPQEALQYYMGTGQSPYGGGYGGGHYPEMSFSSMMEEWMKEPDHVRKAREQREKLLQKYRGKLGKPDAERVKLLARVPVSNL